MPCISSHGIVCYVMLLQWHENIDDNDTHMEAGVLKEAKAGQWAINGMNTEGSQSAPTDLSLRFEVSLRG